MPDDNSKNFTADFIFEKETKNTVKYDEQPESGLPPRIGSLYVQKWALGGEPPRRIKLTVETMR